MHGVIPAGYLIGGWLDKQTFFLLFFFISNIYLTETYNTKDRFRLIVRLDYIIDVYMTNVGRRFGFFLLLTDVYSVITDLFDHCCFNILELGNCHKIPPLSKHSPPNHFHSPMCPPGILPLFLLPPKPGPPLSC